MAVVEPRTVAESLYWSYASLAMAVASSNHDKPTYQQMDYIVRNKLYYGLLRGTHQIGSFLNDEKLKMHTSDACCYCGSQSDLTLDHLIPQFKGGQDSADNLIVACRSCNSSKNALDLIEWMAKRNQFPPLVLLRRYLKLVIQYCVENGRMGIVLEPREGARQKQPSLFDNLDTNTTSECSECASLVWPFAIELIPHTYPDPVDLVGRVPSAEEERDYAKWEAACGPELLAAAKHWHEFSEGDGYILAIYQKGQKKMVEILRVVAAYIDGQRKKTLKLSVVAPEITKDKFFGDYYLNTGCCFDIPIHKVLYTEPISPTSFPQGIQGYHEAIERGREIAKTL